MLCLGFAGYSQTATQYVFSRTSGTVTDISGESGVVLPPTITADDNVITGVPIGFSFVYCGVTYTQLSANSNGFMSLANSTLGGYPSYSNNSGNIGSIASGEGLLMPRWDDLNGSGKTAYYVTTGTAPNRVFTFQWGDNSNGWGSWSGSGEGMFQVKLFESSNVIQFLYGAVTTTYSGNSATIGIASSTSNYQTLSSAGATSTTTGFTTTLSGNIAENSIMTWTPPPFVSSSPATMSFSTGTGTSSASEDASLVAYGLTSGFVTVNAPANFEIFNGSTWVSSMNITTVPAGAGSYINTTFGVRFTAPVTAGPYSGNVTLASAGATTQNIALSADALPMCSGTPLTGVVSGTATSGACSPYNTDLSLIGGTSGVGGLTYQWQSSPDGVAPYTDVVGATNATYTATVGSAVYYRANLGCTVSGMSATSPGAAFTYTAPPVAISGTAVVCEGQTTTLSNATSGGTWTSSNTAVATVGSATGEVMGVSAGTVDIIYTVTASGCTATQTVTVNTSPTPIVVTPSTTTICSGSSAMINASSSFPATSTESSGSLTLTIPDSNPVGLAESLNVNLPAGSIITGVSVNFNVSHTYDYDLIINLSAPNGNTLNLCNQSGGSGDNFTNTTVTSAGGASFGSSSAPFTGTYGATGAMGVGATGFSSNSSSFSDLFSVPNGDWTLSFSDNAGGDEGTFLGWSITIDYTIPPVMEWAPNTDLYTDAGMATPYTGGGAGTLYAAPTTPGLTPVVTVYTISTTVAGCSATATATVTTNPTPEAITGTLNACVSTTSALADATPGGVWSTSSAIASVDGSGVVTAGSVAGTTTVSYALGSCAATATFIVNGGPGVTTGTHTLCTGTTTTLSNPGGVGSWTSASPSIATVDPTTGVVSGIAAGTAVISYSNGCGADVSSVVTVNQTPGAITGASISCVGSTNTLANPDAGGTWSSTNTAAATIDAGSGDVSGVATGTTTIEYTLGNGCVNATRVQTINNAPPTPVVTPATTVACSGTGTAVSAVSMVPGASSVASGSIAVAIPDNNSGGVSDALNVSLPPGAIITGVSVNYNITHTYDGDLIVNLTAPNGSTLNLVNGSGGGGDNFVNTTVSSTGSTSFGSSSAPFTGVFAATAAIGRGATAYTSDAASFSELYSVADGNWIMSIRDQFGGDNGTLTSWTLNFEYNVPAQMTWAPNTGLYTDAGLSTAYTGTATPSIYAAPEATGSVPVVTVYTVTATESGCSSTGTATVTTNPLPAMIGGDLTVCQGLTTTLTNADGGGIWSTSIPAIASIDMSTGVVTGVAAGLTNVTYTFTGTGCMRIATITVNPLPAAISGSTQLCEAGTTNLTNATGGGTWASGNTSIATVDASTGVVSGLMGGTSMITYALPTGCISTAVANVSPLPVVTVTPTTATTFCIGESTSAYSVSSTMPSFTLLNQDFNSGLGNWTIENVLGASAGQWQIVASGFDGSTGDGSSMLQASAALAGPVHTRLVSPSFSTVGYSAVTLAFNQFIISDITDAKADVEYSIDGGSSWLPVVSYVTAIAGSATWTAGTPDETLALPAGALGQANVMLRWDYNGGYYGWFLDNISVTTELPAATYTWTGGSDLSCTTCTIPTITPSASGMNVYTVTATGSTGCTAEGTVTVNVNPLPSAIGGALAVCEGLNTTLNSTPAGGTWTSSNTSVATVDASTGVATGQTAGTTTITYTLPTGCEITAELTVNALPADITGTMFVCEGLTTTLNNTTSGGTWSSNAPAIANVDGSGVVTGNAAGNADIIFTITATGCIKTADVTVNPLPAAITGTQDVCEGLTTTLSSATTGGTWTSGSTANATVDASTGLVSGVSEGSAMITYTLSTGCLRAANVTVNLTPDAIAGTMDVCVGLTQTLTNTTSGGTWSSSNTSVATIDASTGVMTGMDAGTATITYAMPTGCMAVAEVTVNPLPAVISGTQEVCEGLTTTLNSAPTGGTWTSGSTVNATVDASTGLVSGVSEGSAMITYTLSTGCLRAANVTVNLTPDAIAGTMDVCVGLTQTLTNTTSGGTWSSSNTSVATIDASTAVMTGMDAGTATITYAMPTGCMAVAEATVNPLPTGITGNQEVCEGLTTTLSSTPAGGSWTSSSVANATVDASTGVVTGVLAGSAIVTYTLPTGCITAVGVTVNPLPVASTGAMQVCEGATMTMANGDAGGTWSTSTPSIADIDVSLGVVTGIAAGTTVITYTLPTSCIITDVVTVNPLPIVSTVTGGGSYCFSGSGVNIGMDTSDVKNTYYLMTGGSTVGTQSGTDATIDFGAYTAAGTYTVMATSDKGCNQDMAGSATVVIIPLITPAVSISTTPGDTVCDGTSVTFTATPVNGGTTPVFEWSVNGTIMGGTDTYSYTPSDNDTVSVVLASSEACPSPALVSDEMNMVVVSNETPVATVIVGPNDTICQHSTAVFHVSSSFGGDAPVYSWAVNGTPTGTSGDLYSFVPVDGDVVTCKLNSNYRCPIVNNVTSNAITMQVDSVYVPIVKIDANPGFDIQMNQSVTFTANVTKGGPAPTYQWFLNDMPIVGEDSATYTVDTLSNMDSVSCVVYGTGDCSFFTFNSVIMRVSTGVATTSVMKDADLRLMPNPNTGEFLVEGTLGTNENTEVSLEVTNMLGQVVYRNTVNVVGGKLNERVQLRNSLANGMYMLNVRSGTESNVFRFVLKQ